MVKLQLFCWYSFSAIGLIWFMLGGVQLAQMLIGVLRAQAELAADTTGIASALVNTGITYVMSVWVLPGLFVGFVGFYFINRIRDRLAAQRVINASTESIK